MSQTNVNLFFISVKNPLRRFDEGATQACKLALKKGEKEWKGRRKRYKSNPKTKSITKIGDWAKQSINKPNQRSQWNRFDHSLWPGHQSPYYSSPTI